MRRLFLAEEKALADVMKYMEDKHKFHARLLIILQIVGKIAIWLIALVHAAKHNTSDTLSGGSSARTSRIPSGNLSIAASRRGREKPRTAPCTLVVSLFHRKRLSKRLLCQISWLVTIVNAPRHSIDCILVLSANGRVTTVI